MSTLDHLRSKYKYPERSRHWHSERIPTISKEDDWILKKLAQRAEQKSKIRIGIIRNQVKKYMETGRHNTDPLPKKWQVKSYYEGRRISDKFPGMTIFEDMDMLTNKLTTIHASIDDDEGNGFPICYDHKKVPRIYVGFVPRPGPA